MLKRKIKDELQKLEVFAQVFPYGVNQHEFVPALFVRDVSTFTHSVKVVFLAHKNVMWTRSLVDLH
jgi:hypothetical protein